MSKYRLSLVVGYDSLPDLKNALIDTYGEIVSQSKVEGHLPNMIIQNGSRTVDFQVDRLDNPTKQISLYGLFEEWQKESERKN